MATKPGMSIAEELKTDGYSQEERYFYRHNRELIEKRRRAAMAPRTDRTTATAPAPQKRGFWGRLVGRLLKGDTSWRP